MDKLDLGAIVTILTLVGGWFGWNSKKKKAKFNFRNEAKKLIEQIYREDILPFPAMYNQAHDLVEKMLWTLLKDLKIKKTPEREALADDLIDQVLTRLGAQVLGTEMKNLANKARGLEEAMGKLKIVPDKPVDTFNEPTVPLKPLP